MAQLLELGHFSHLGSFRLAIAVLTAEMLAVAGCWGVRHWELTVGLLRPAHTSTKKNARHASATSQRVHSGDPCGSEEMVRGRKGALAKRHQSD